MTNSTKAIGLIMTLALWAGVATAQGLPASGLGDDTPPEMNLPSFEGIPLPDAAEEPSAAPTSPTPAPISTPAQAPAQSTSSETFSVPSSSDYDPSTSTDQYIPDGAGLWTEVAPIESTGTWLRRGFWYAEADAVVFNRMWNRYDLRLAAEDEDVNTPPVNGQSLGFNPIFLDTNRLLIINGSLPGRDAAVRTTLGHFLFRDSRNRDHTLEFTAFGGGDWEQNRVMTSEEPNGLFVPFIIDGGNPSFDNSTRQTVDYESHYKSFEMNYRVKERLGHDQLVMDPNGHWHRAANAGFEREYLAGLRMMELEDRFDWRAEDIVNTGDDGRYFIRTDNDLFGFQLGGGLTYQAPRWSIGAVGKGGVFLNDALGRTQLNFTADDVNDSDLRLRENQLSFVTEFKLQGRFHITPNVSLRGAYELMYLTSLAMAPPQATFIPEFSYLNTTGDPFYHGASFGFEGYW